MVVPAQAQVSPYGPLRSALEIATKKPTGPLEPPGNPGLLPKTANRLPDPQEENANVFKVVRAGEVHYVGDEVHINDGGELLIRGYRVFANAARGNRRTQIWELDGNVKVIGRDVAVDGERVIVDFQNETYRSFNAESQMDPQFLNNPTLRDKVYVSGRESYGSQREVRATDSDFTTCNYPHPHFEIAGEETTVQPGVRAIIRRARFRLFDHTLFTLPYLLIPLQDRNYKYTPDVGQSPDEGYYVKNRYGLPLKRNRFLDTRLDYMSKLGTGTGAGYGYQSAKSNGELTVYKITGKSDALNFSNRHDQTFSFGRLTLANDIQRNNYLSAPGTTMMQNRANLEMPWAGGRTRLGYGRTNNDSTNFSSTNQTITIGDDRRFGSSLNTRLNVNYSSNASRGFGSGTKREQIDVQFQGDQELRKATASLEYQRSIPVGDTTNFYSGADRTPVLTLASDARRLFGDSADRAFPFRTSLSLGEFQGTTQGSQITRSAFDFNFQKYGASQQRFKTDFNGQFRQGVYSDDTAQYTLTFGSGMTYRTGPRTAVNLRYNYLRPYGYTPLVIDRTGQTNQVTLDGSAEFFRSLKLGLQTGYDILQLKEKRTPWQQVGVRSEWQPHKWFMLRGLSNYDSINQKWSSVRLDMTYLPGATALTVGARFDGVRHTWSSLNLVLENLKIGRTRLSTILQYNGYTKRFDSKQYNLIYDLHCAEAIVNVTENNIGFRPGREVQFLIRLKAFPFGTNFGNGRRGQPLGVGTGRDF